MTGDERGHCGGHDERHEICYTVVFSQCKNQQIVIQLKAYDKKKHTVDCIAEQWHLLLKYNEFKKSLKLEKIGYI